MSSNTSDGIDEQAGYAKQNWSRNLTYSAESFAAPTSVDELAGLVSGSARVKAIGSRHCFNTVADTDGLHLSTRRLPIAFEVDPSRRTVRTGGGALYGELAAWLQEQGWALPNLASLPHISIAGAVATGTHGSGDGVGSLASAVDAVELVTAAGELVRYQRGDADFDGVVVSLGALGIVTAVELDIVPTFEVAQTVYERLPWDAVLADLDAVTSLGYSTSLFTTWTDPDVIEQFWLKRRTDSVLPAPDAVLGSLPAVEKRHPLPGVSAQSCTEQLGQPGPWLDRLPHFKLEFTPSNGDELQSEFLVPRSHAVHALDAIRSLSGEIAPLLQVCEVRTMASDSLWLSPAQGRASVGIHFTWKPDQPGVEALLPRIETALSPAAARPHWGKLFTAKTLRERAGDLYPRWGNAVSLIRRTDPDRVFDNGYLNRLGI